MTVLQRILIGAVTAAGLVAPPGAGARAQTVIEEWTSAKLPTPPTLKPATIVPNETALLPDHQRVTRPGKGQRGTARVGGANRRHAPDLEAPSHVEHHGVERGSQGDHGRRHPAVERRRVPVEVADLDPLVDQVVVVRGGVRAVDDSLEVGLGDEGRGREQ